MQSDLHCDDQKFYSLEKHFKKACSRHPQLKFLKAQWRFDQELIGKALQNVGTIFPHYSRHDASHSRQIIVNIERILGDKIKFLSATDTWLILEAAYNHDIGMVITGKQIEDLNTKEFNEFLKSISEDQNNPLQKFAKDWITDKGVLPQDAKAHEFFHQYIQLLSEWYRPRHPEQSAETVRNPVEEIGLNSPRTELLPKRLFNILGLICKAHGDSFQEVLKLPKAEAGMANEDCHPLYVACLLRMGDLLDVDDNRFCPVMLAMCGKNLPAISKAHNEKHHSIKHLRLDSERIEIKCVCPTPEAYETAYDWFSWLQTEYHEQTQHWDKIVPCKELGRLPTLMTPDVDIAYPFLILENGKRPDFKVNKETILNLVRGTGLYEDEYDAIREILQNAVDSTIHRIWIEKGKEIIDKNLDPSMQALYDIYDQYKIDYSFKEKEGSPGIYILTVTDKGTGISRNDLEYMTEIGSSFKNKAKKDREKEMPMWFRPSGAFGIGLQSAYLLADKFTILTHSMIDGKKLEIQFNKTKNNNIIIKEITSDIPIGTQFIIEINLYNDKQDHLDLTNNILFNQDLIISDRYNHIQYNINSFFTNAPIQTLKNNKRILQNFYFDKNTKILLSDIEFKDSTGNCEFYFRGQEFDGLDIQYQCMNCTINFFHTTSNEFLTYNRNTILPDAKLQTKKLLHKTFKNYIENKKQFNKFSETDKIYAASCYIHYFADKKNIDIQLLNYFNQFPVLIGDKTETVDAILKKIIKGNLKEIYAIDDFSLRYDDDFIKITTTTKFQQVIHNISLVSLFNNIKFMISQASLYYTESHNDFGVQEENSISISNHDVQPICNKTFRNLISDIKFNGIQRNQSSNKLIFPAWQKYRKLSINEQIQKHFDILNIYDYISNQEDYLILPINLNHKNECVNFYDNSDQFINFVYKYRKNQNVTIEEIKTLNKQLIDHIKEILRTTPDEEDESDDE